MRQGLVVGVFLISVSAIPAGAQQAGDVVQFLVPQNTNLTTGAEGDVVIFSGKPAGTINPSGCTNAGDATPRFLHSGVAVDAGSGDRPTRLVGSIIVLYTNGAPQDTAVRSGTRIGNLGIPTQCTIGGQPYDKYFGIVQ